MSDPEVYIAVEFMFDFENCVIKSFKSLYMLSIYNHNYMFCDSLC